MTASAAEPMPVGGTRFYCVLRELVGGVADVAMLLPMLAGLVAAGGVSGSASLVAVGATYIVAAIYFRVPMPVQPLKALAALALTADATSAELRLAALAFGVALALVATTSLRRRLETVPIVVVHATQFGLAALLLSKAAGAAGAVHPFAPIGLGVAVVGLVFLQARRDWPMLGVVALGSLAWWAFAQAGNPSEPAVREAVPPRLGLVLTMVASQLPLTLANSVVATRAAAEQYFGAARASRVTLSGLLGSITFTSFLASALGTLPTCHGAGGLTAHVKGGARIGYGPAAYGGALIVLGLATFGAPTRLELPRLGVAVLLALTGAHHVALTRASFANLRTAWPVVASGVVTLATDSLLAGVVAAIAALGMTRRGHEPAARGSR